MNPKRQRVKQACDHCRSKKAKCDGLMPTCSSCKFNHETCTYAESSKRRGLPPGYTRDLEKKVALLSALIGELCHEDHTVKAKMRELIHDEDRMLRIIGESKWETSLITSLSDQFINKYGGKVPERKQYIKPEPNLSNQLQPPLAEDIPTIQIPAASQQPIPAVPVSVPVPAVPPVQHAMPPVASVQPTSTPFFYDPISDPSFFFNYDIFQFISDEVEPPTSAAWEPIALQYHGLSQLISGFTNRAIQKYNFARNPFRVGSIFNVSSFVNAIKPPPEIFAFPINSQAIVDDYFRIYHPWIPMLDRVSIVRQVSQLTKPRPPIPTDGGQSPPPDLNLIALVWAVLAIGQLAASPLEITNTQTYAKHAIVALENSITSTIETIQAQVLLGMYYYQIGLWDFSWVLISSGSRMAIDVRLMRPSAPGGPENEIEQSANGKKYITTLNNINRERTWASVFIINTVLAARMGRSPVVRAMDWPIPSINTDGWEEWESWEGDRTKIKLDAGRFLSTFNEAIKVVSIVNLAITSNIDTSKGMLDDEIGGVKIEQEQDFTNSNTLTIAKFKSMLNDWYDDLPDYCRIEQYTPDAIPAPIAFLHLGRDLTWCILAIRLSSLKDVDVSINNRILKSRDFQYTRAITSIRGIINERTVAHLQYYPFIDYFLIMCLNFPHMIDLPPHERDKVIRDFRSCLTSASATSIPCKISLDIYKLMNTDIDNSAKESPMIANLLNSPEESVPIGGRSKSLVNGVNNTSTPPPPRLIPSASFPPNTGASPMLPFPPASHMSHLEGLRAFRNDEAGMSTMRQLPRVNSGEYSVKDSHQR
ncbi:uncharacterized protein SPAPADRAFT_137814 [Spathaspora passalidarum NRRL Y-27907]|uniref:Zn(2)-C6 fungal-type domain-containing protein n=1 Tax=Spathaspora passalidarum (strain NRRL Y-27907 / 11-Y1) TaxID=619300 RepID=G3AKR3_SPAPN|nr:uncharacterized protein SPAPADRAFT_137814 [Spathaspora passalidarum NRRL Y-27907]EGW32967.1 hypothetical protein SPAPADRAFT_137814 [Spathaspora passalidarum NRRL Y-27907]